MNLRSNALHSMSVIDIQPHRRREENQFHIVVVRFNCMGIGQLRNFKNNSNRYQQLRLKFSTASQLFVSHRLKWHSVSTWNRSRSHPYHSIVLQRNINCDCLSSFYLSLLANAYQLNEMHVCVCGRQVSATVNVIDADDDDRLALTKNDGPMLP